MFDEQTLTFMRSAPELSGLAAEEIDRLLIRAHAEVAAARVRIVDTQGSDSEMTSIMSRLRSLANVFEAMVVLKRHHEKYRPAAFVAASARQVLAKTGRILKNPLSTHATEHSISFDLSACLLYLIADRPVDAFEAAREIEIPEAAFSVEQAVCAMCKYLAQGKLLSITEAAATISLDEIEIDSDGILSENVARLLYGEIAYGINDLARYGLGVSASALDEAEERFARVRELSVLKISSDEGISTVSSYTGPFHLASLLERFCGSFVTSCFAHLQPPEGVDANAWTGWVRNEAARYPYLWENHRRAIDTGFLKCGHSLVATSPTGTGKTTLAAMKAAATICSGRSVVYLAPTNALVTQVARDLGRRLEPIGSSLALRDDVEAPAIIGLPEFTVLTPEKCLSLLIFEEAAFSQVGLVIFDEFHLLGTTNRSPKSTSPDRRSVDAMLCVLAFLQQEKPVDFLLLSAMVKNGSEVAEWLSSSLGGRPVHCFEDTWRPTRQVRSCVAYMADEIAEQTTAIKRKETPRTVPAAVPYGIFNLENQWNTSNHTRHSIIPLSEAPRLLSISKSRNVASNRNETARYIAERLSTAGIKVVVFCETVTYARSIVRKMNGEALQGTARDVDPEVALLRQAVIEEVGSGAASENLCPRRAVVHHADLLPEEKELAEMEYCSTHGEVNVLVCTSTLAQGMNLPCEAVVLAGTDRYDDDDRKRKKLEPHEILNSLGRSGRAGYAATGFSIVIPGEIVRLRKNGAPISQAEILKTVFDKIDTSVTVFDPLTILIDNIEVLEEIDPLGLYAVRRLRSLAGDLKKTVNGFFGLHSKGTDEKEKWIVERMKKWEVALDIGKSEEEASWQEQLAGRLGVSRSLVDHLQDIVTSAPSSVTSVNEWTSWLFSSVRRDFPPDEYLIRLESAERVFQRAWHNTPFECKIDVLLNGISAILPLWLSGKTLIEIEKEIVKFIREHEGIVKQPTQEDGYAKHARRFALRLVPDIAYLFKVVNYVTEKTYTHQGKTVPTLVQYVPALVRRGCDSLYQFCILTNGGERSRVGSHRLFLSLEESLGASPSDDMAAARNKVELALADADFTT